MRFSIDTVAREKRYLALTGAPLGEEAFNFFRGLVESGSPSVNDTRWRHAHGVWHLFVLGGSGAHSVTVLFFVR